MGWIALVVLVACGAGVVLQENPAELIGLSDPAAAHLVKAAAMIISIGGALFLSFSERAGFAFRQAANWSAIAVALISIYAYRGDLISMGTELAGNYAPSGPAVSEQAAASDGQRRMVAIRAEQNGQFNVNTLINRTHISMLADTGATLITLTEEDARRAGIDMQALEYNVPLRTANGTTYGALIDLDEVDVGGILVRQVPAVVSQAGVLHVSLLGMSYFRQIGTFELSGDQLILRE
jgi:aspartyl protease family protein